MPTPFSHLVIAQRLLADPEVPESLRALLETERPAYLLGSIAVDARVDGKTRDATHFYSYGESPSRPLWRVMLEHYPTLEHTHSDGQRAFLAGYAAHLAADAIWSRDMVMPRFIQGDWSDTPHHDRFIALHLLLIHMDERDRPLLAGWQAPTLLAALPNDWLPFMPDPVLTEWRDFVGCQIAPDGESKTVEIFAKRIDLKPRDMRAMLDDPSVMQWRLWDHIPSAVLAEVEAACYTNARQQMAAYFAEYGA